ncbi:MAG: STAS domain-containing protein [Roseovarius sp.]|jgi:anti-sigma B factor antagonist|uniref:STAS domain-containing protein n=1 Tax=Roseovarius sp. TaxID=1486281 RepID=UPI001B55CDCE|nr:STAS domain-containing protein [Roseovarius sp.]MBQ0749218.1 STAS domain-containing protein [Roseovarius sp.]MBQ0811711.1 STAS domain-containing protein [Roseovarius sp.]
MDLHATHHPDLTIITVAEARIDAAAAIRFKDAMRAATATGAGHVVLDLGNVTFVDSSGLGAIVAAMKQMGSERRLDLACLTPDVAKVFRLTRMESVFTIHDDLRRLHSRATG